MWRLHGRETLYCSIVVRQYLKKQEYSTFRNREENNKINRRSLISYWDVLSCHFIIFFPSKSSPSWEELGSTAGSLYILFRSGDRHITRSKKKRRTKEQQH